MYENDTYTDSNLGYIQFQQSTRCVSSAGVLYADSGYIDLYQNGRIMGPVDTVIENHYSKRLDPCTV